MTEEINGNTWWLCYFVTSNLIKWFRFDVQNMIVSINVPLCLVIMGNVTLDQFALITIIVMIIFIISNLLGQKYIKHSFLFRLDEIAQDFFWHCYIISLTRGLYLKSQGDFSHLSHLQIGGLGFDREWDMLIINSHLSLLTAFGRSRQPGLTIIIHFEVLRWIIPYK